MIAKLTIEGSNHTENDADLAPRVAALERHQRPSADAGAHSEIVLHPTALLHQRVESSLRAR